MGFCARSIFGRAVRWTPVFAFSLGSTAAEGDEGDEGSAGHSSSYNKEILTRDRYSLLRDAIPVSNDGRD